MSDMICVAGLHWTLNDSGLAQIIRTVRAKNSLYSFMLFISHYNFTLQLVVVLLISRVI